MAQDWDIKPRGEACHACQKPFEDKQSYYSALNFGEEGYSRADYCESCRPSVTATYSIWKGVFRTPPPPKEEALKKETAENLLRRLMQAEDTSKINVIYILAVMLERKRTLVERDVQYREDGSKILVYEHRGTGETFLVPDPRLRLDQLEQVQQEVIDMLGPETSAAPAAVEPPAPC